MIEKWQFLIDRLELLENHEEQEIWTEEELNTFQSETGIILPDAYKTYCQVFGSGLLGNYMRIYCPSLNSSNLFIDSIKDEINRFPDLLHETILDLEFLNELLDSAFVFGDNARADIVFWDLRTYSESDNSYDIYIANSDCFDGEIHQIGRDFYEFVRDFCLGMKSYELLPELMRPAPQELILTFCPFDPRPGDIELDSWRQNQMIWQQNVNSGIVLKMAQTYEDQGQLKEALLLYIKYLKIATTSREERINLSKKLQYLQHQLGELQFSAICQAASYSALDLPSINASLTTSVNPEPQNLRFTVEHFTNPSPSFQQACQEFFQEVNERLTTINSKEDSISSQQESEIVPILAEFIQTTQTSQISYEDFQQASETMARSLQSLVEQFPPSHYFLDEKFKHLHLPPGIPITYPKFSNETADREIAEQEMAVREGNPYAFFRYLKTLKGHSSSVYQVKFSPDGLRLASASADSTVKLWDLRLYQQIYTLSGHTDAVISLAMSPNGKLLASGSADSHIKLWDIGTGEEIQTLIGHTSSVLSLAISPDGQTLVSSSSDRTIKLWNLNTGQVIRTLRNHNHSVLCVDISPDGQTLASGSADSTLKLWDLITGQEICTLDRETRFVFAVNFHPNGEKLASVDGDQKIKLWNLSSREVLLTIPNAEIVVSLAISPDGLALADACESSPSKTIGIWDFKTGKLICSFSGDDGLVNHRGIVYDVAFSPDGKMLASAGQDTTVKLWGIPAPLDV